MQVSEVSESHLWSGPGPPGAACSQWALCSAPGTGSQMETRGDTTHCVHWPHWPWGTSGGPSEPRVRDIYKSSETKRRFENPVTESLSSNLLLTQKIPNQSFSLTVGRSSEREERFLSSRANIDFGIALPLDFISLRDPGSASSYI